MKRALVIVTVLAMTSLASAGAIVTGIVTESAAPVASAIDAAWS